MCRAVTEQRCASGVSARRNPANPAAHRLPRGLRGFWLKARRFASTIVKLPPLAGLGVHNARKR